MEMRCRCSDVEEWRYGALEARSGPGDVEARNSGGALHVVQTRRYEGLWVRCRRSDIDVWRSWGWGRCRCIDVKVEV